jgi:hypothetical protein
MMLVNLWRNAGKISIFVLAIMMLLSGNVLPVAAPPTTINYVTFWESGVGSDFTGTVATIAGGDLRVIDLATCHTVTTLTDISFAYHTPLVVNPSKQYVWIYTTSNLEPTITTRTGTVPGNSSGVVWGYYATQYKVDFYSSPTSGGSTNPTDSIWITQGSTSISATAAPGYRFTTWSVTGGITVASPTSQSTSATVSGAGTITANFETVNEEHYTITPSAIGSGSISPSSKVTVSPGGSATFTFHPEDGYTIKSVKVDGNLVAVSSKYTFSNVNADHTITVTFTEKQEPAIDEAVITFNGPYSNQKTLIIDGVSVSTPVRYSWPLGTSHTIEAPNTINVTREVRYTFNSWSDGGNRAHTITVTSTQSISANYTKQYILTINSNFGTTTPNDGTWIDEGTPIVVKATPPVANDGEAYIFGGWNGYSGGYSGGSNPSEPFLMNSPVTMVTNWQHIYRLKIVTNYGEAVGEGWYEIGESEFIYIKNTVVQDTDNTRYVFTGWSGDVTASTSGILVRMDTPKTLVAEWKPQYKLSFTGSGFDSSAQGQILTVNGTAVYVNNLPYTTDWIDVGKSINYAYGGTLTSSQFGYVIALSKVNGPTSPLIVSAPAQITGIYSSENTMWPWIYYGLPIFLAVVLLIALLLRRRREN